MPSQPDLLPSCHPLIVHCKYDEIVALDAYPPHPKNDNTHPPEQIALFEKILRHQGIRRAAVVSNLTKRFVTGHGMLATLRQMGITGIPVDHQTFASEEDELRHLMADNRLPSLAVRDDGQTLANLEELTDLDLGLELTGFTDADMQALDLDPGDGFDDGEVDGKKKKPGKQIDLTEVFEITIECKGEAHQRELYERFKKEGLKCRLLTL